MIGLDFPCDELKVPFTSARPFMCEIADHMTGHWATGRPIPSVRRSAPFVAARLARGCLFESAPGCRFTKMSRRFDKEIPCLKVLFGESH